MGSARSFFRKRLEALSGKQIRRIFLCVLLAAAAVLLQLYRNRCVERLADQNEGARWSDRQDAAQISCFFTAEADVTPVRIREFRYRLDQALADNSLAEEESANSAARLWMDAYAAADRVSVTRDEKSAKMNAIGVGGDFFYFHPMQLVSGVLLNGDTGPPDGVVVDEDCAWQFFGSDNVTGQRIDINGTPCYIIGVVRRARGRIADAAGLSESVLYLPYEALYGSASGSEAEEGTGRIDCYEAVLPNPVQGFAASMVREKLGVEETQMQVVDNTARFGLPALAGVIASFGTRSMQSASVRYPWWENTARGWEDILSLVLLVQAACLTVIVGCAVGALVRGYRHKQWTAGSVLRAAQDRIYDIRTGRARQRKRRRKRRSRRRGG